MITIQLLQRALDEMHERGMPLNEFRVMPPSERKLRAGGNAVVQLVRRLSDNRQFAAKFYLDATPFDRETALRMSDRFADLLPRPLYIDSNSHGDLCTASGTRIPPHAVFDKGECLEEWLERKPRTLRQCVGVLLAVANLLRAVHARGLAHRALHPRNIIWMPVSSQWTIADFGWAAQIGRSAGVRLDPPYTPPESTYAASHGGTCSVEASVDIWALGMIAQELIHGGLPTAHLASPSERTMSDTDADHSPDASVQAYLTGVSSRLKISHTDTLDCESLKDGLLKEDYDSLAHSIQACLAHEPALRPNVIELSQQWKSVLEHGATGTL